MGKHFFIVSNIVVIPSFLRAILTVLSDKNLLSGFIPVVIPSFLRAILTKKMKNINDYFSKVVIPSFLRAILTLVFIMTAIATTSSSRNPFFSQGYSDLDMCCCCIHMWIHES